MQIIKRAMLGSSFVLNSCSPAPAILFCWQIKDS